MHVDSDEDDDDKDLDDDEDFDDDEDLDESDEDESDDEVIEIEDDEPIPLSMIPDMPLSTAISTDTSKSTFYAYPRKVSLTPGAGEPSNASHH